MASLIGFRTARPCISCMRQLTASFDEVSFSSIQQQTRGKKKLVNTSSIKVRLLADIVGYGRQGTVMQIQRGRMRNDWYPQKLAEYITKAQIRELGLENAVVERDSSFGIARPVDLEQEVKRDTSSPARAPKLVLDLLDPDKATSLLSMLLPYNVDFYRTPIAAPVFHKPRSSSIPATSALSAAAEEATQLAAPRFTSIYGSVTTADIAANLRAVLAEDDEGARVVLSPEEITFVEETEEQDRVKHLGIFEFDIRVKGASDAVRRTIRVNAQG